MLLKIFGNVPSKYKGNVKVLFLLSEFHLPLVLSLMFAFISEVSVYVNVFVWLCSYVHVYVSVLTFFLAGKIL